MAWSSGVAVRFGCKRLVMALLGVWALSMCSLAKAEPAAEGEKLEQGLTLSFTPSGAAAATDARSARLVSLYVPAGSTPSPFVAPGRFVAVWDGYLNLRLRDAWAFSALGRGTLSVTINDKPAFEASGDDLSKKPGEAIKLKKGKNHIVVRYESPASGDAAVRLMWDNGDDTTQFFEPVSPNLFTHDAGAAAVAGGDRLRAGRELVAELRCVRCHAVAGTPAPDGGAAAGEGHPASGGPMPELSMDAPSLADVGARLNVAWLAAWVNDPHSLRPDAHMPRLFHDDKSPQTGIDPRASDVAAYLASLQAAPAAQSAPGWASEGAAKAGGRLFANLNCIACHSSPDPKLTAAADSGAAGGDAAGAASGAGAAPAPPERTPLKFVAAKFKPEALRQFLLKPEAHYAWTPMPNFRLSQEEASELAAFLLRSAAGKLPAAPATGDPARGKALVASIGCLDCHAIGKEQSELKAPTLADIPAAHWNQGCMAKESSQRKGAPDFSLTDDQRLALSAFAATDRASLLHDVAPEFAERQIAEMRCAACHMRDGRESLLATTFDPEQKLLQEKFPNPPPAGGAESFSPDQRAPLLTWAGEKLRPEWIEQFIAGKVPYKPRPYLYARMPGFVARGAMIGQGLVEEHGCTPALPPEPKPDAAMAAIGEKLAGRTPNQAFSCVQCHAVANQAPFAPFEAPAINFDHARDRLRKDYFHRWIHNPLRVDPNTKMPAFERDDGKTSISTVYDGDARKQFEAIWQYLLEGDAIKPPAQ